LRPAHVFANPCPDAQVEIVALLQGPWRFALRLVMIWLSLRGLTASQIAALFDYDPRTVRRWVERFNCEGVAGWRTVRARERLGWEERGWPGVSEFC
jgi:Homeodomain-like domain